MSDENLPTPPFSTAGVASAEEGYVILDGPDGIAIAMEPEAADATGRSLIDAARAARRQRGENGQGQSAPTS